MVFFEKRRPKLFDNLLQALALAPLFVWLEILFYCGYRRNYYKMLQAKVNLEILRIQGGKVISEAKRGMAK